ncbi:uncharacterized protein BYT42DRAFT_581113 [Radiomyces spectabilis]|uniref:uncharacterized protein n=1 Tax=Radiomyces spectabilis TaxID=64574 RepID=UPI00221EB234|nr:uncharacterized protein BYT42DRAFT_581113 [Radiomyces spectabilis]KAI8371685.1 hypothetical protein BYT42DRAFT_581113 [Radiomyces spectabilis]
MDNDTTAIEAYTSPPRKSRDTPSLASSESPTTPNYRAWLMWWNTDEWWPCWIGLLFFGCITTAVSHGVPQPEFLPWKVNPFSTFATPGNYGIIVLFFAVGLLLWLALAAVRTPAWRIFPLGYAILFFVALVSKILAANVTLHKASIGDSIWAIIFGCTLRNLISLRNQNAPMPSFLKVAQQTEFYIATSLVLLCIDIHVLRPLAPRALFISWIDTPSLFMIVALFGWRFLRIDRQTAIIMSGATFICGSSAAIALGASMGVPHKTEMPIAIISIFTIPSIIALPYVAKRLGLSATVSGAWFGGCVDSTGAVIASASIYGDKDAVNTSAVVKMMQNVLIGPLSVAMAWAWSRYELQAAYKKEEELLRHAGHVEDAETGSTDVPMTDIDHSRKSRSRQPSSARRETALELLWKRFPKFVLGFLITAVLFNTVIASDAQKRIDVNNFCFYVSEWFSTLSFVSIGLGLHLNEMKRNIRSLGKLCSLYVIAQLVDIAITGVLAWTAFEFM